MKTPHLSALTLFLAGTTAALLFVFGLQALGGGGHIQETLSQAGQELLPEAFAGFDTDIINLYSGTSYLSWPNSTTLNADDTMLQTLSFLQMTTTQKNSPTTLTDINGDGLVDILYHNYSTGSGYYSYSVGAFLNDGNLGFTWAYKCQAEKTPSTSFKYYGDCAG